MSGRETGELGKTHQHIQVTGQLSHILETSDNHHKLVQSHWYPSYKYDMRDLIPCAKIHLLNWYAVDGKIMIGCITAVC